MGVLKSVANFFKPTAKSKMQAYEGASVSHRVAGWQPSNAGINTIVFSNAGMLRARSRSLIRNNAWAASGINALVSNLVGTGIKPHSAVSDPKIKEKIQTLWSDWVYESDAHGMLSFYGMQSLIARNMIEAGESIVRMRPRLDRDGLSVPLQLQILEPDHLSLDQTRDFPNGRRIRAGIEFDEIGRRAAYHLYREHPGDLPLGGSFNGDAVAVPASEIVHVFRVLRPGQLRGEPWLTPALIKLHDLDEYDDHELYRAKVAASVSGFITKPDIDQEYDERKSNQPDDEGVVELVWKPGEFHVLGSGQNVAFSDSHSVGGQYEVFMRNQLRAVAVAMGVTYEQLTGDLTDVNYSSIRAGTLEFRRMMEQHQTTIMVHQFCQKVYRRWMDQAVLSGKLNLPGYSQRRREYQRVKWIAQGWQWVDPQKEASAQANMVRNGIISRSMAVASAGHDVEEVDAAITADNRRVDKNNIVVDSDPRKRTRSGAVAEKEK